VAKKKTSDKKASLQWTGLGLVIVAAVAAFVWWQQQSRRDSVAVTVTVPRLSALAQDGEEAFGENCAACHGANAGGSGKGPPLIHKIYEPNHHADGSVVRAIAYGVKAHHWPFGNMPPQPQVTADQTRAIIAYLREVQRANGIY
jgi:mono/diheme cytochrome c family protein